MRQALWILRKDVRAMRVRIGLVWTLMAITGVAEAMIGRHPSLAGTWIMSLPVDLAVWFLVISVVQEDRLVGDRQFWVTRPYSWKSMLLAKVLFVLLILNLPHLLDQIVALAINGLSPAQYAAQLLSSQAEFVGGMVATLALAAVTSNIVELLLAVLAIFVAPIAAIVILAPFGLLIGSPRGVVEPFDGAFHGTIAVLLLIPANLRQFGKRDTLWARVLVATAIIAWMPLYTIPWGTAFRLISRFSPAVDPSVAVLSLDGARQVSPFPGALGRFKHDVLLPIQLTGIPVDTELFSQRARVELRAPDGSTWDSGWDPENQVRDQTSASNWEWRLLPGKGAPYWLRASLDAPFYHKHGDELLRVHVTVAFTLLGHPAITPIKVWDRPVSVGGNDTCSFTARGSAVTTYCLAPFAAPALTMMRFQPLPSGDRNEYPIGAGPLGAGPGNAFGIWRLRQTPVESPPEPFAASIELRQAIGNFQRELEFPAIRLKEFGER
jgi:hypothetical protein